jgi:hypothetical protein
MIGILNDLLLHTASFQGAMFQGAMSGTKVVQLLTSGSFSCYEEWRQVLPQQQK